MLSLSASRCSRPFLTRSVVRQQQQRVRRSASSKAAAGPMEADAGALATRVHHHMTTSLAVLTPIYFLTPDSMTDGAFSKMFGLFLTANITAHSWIGLNYVATDYVPKVSKALLGPARVFNFGLAVVTMLGVGRIAVSSPGGIKGAIKGLWNPPEELQKKQSGQFDF